MAGLSTAERQLLDELVASEKEVLTAEDVIVTRQVSRPAANQILARLRRKGWVRQVKRGMYMPVPLGSSTPEPAVEDAWPLAASAFAPCYISGWTAAEHWDLTEQIFNSICVVTARPQRKAEQTLAGVPFRTRSIAKDRIFGTKTVWLKSQRVEVADPHRMLVDIIDDPSLGGGGRQTLDIVAAYWKSKHADPARVLDYAVRFGRGVVFKRLGFTAERLGVANRAWLDACRSHISAGISRLDPAGPNRGPIVTRWRLRANLPFDET
jgi:predicted transcriptional regulator of viral defense system